MKRAGVAILLPVVVLLLSPTCSADTVQVNITATFTAYAPVAFPSSTLPSNCPGCTDTFEMSFQYDPAWLTYDQFMNHGLVNLVFSSSGFLGNSFMSIGQHFATGPGFYIALRTGTPGGGTGYDEVDIVFQYGGPVSGLELYACGTPDCMGAYGLTQQALGLFLQPTYQQITETRVPEPGTVALLSLGMMVLVGYRRRRRISQS